MDNKDSAHKIIRFFAFAWILLLGLFVASLLVKVDVPLALQILLGVLTFGLGIGFGLGGFYYLEFKIENNHYLQVRYFNLSPIGREYKSFKIELSRFYSFQVKKVGPFGYLYLFEESGKGVAKYPKLGLSAMSNSQRNAFLKFIHKLNKR